MPRRLAVVLFGVLVALSGVAQGLWTGRWADAAEPKAALARLAALPRTVGEGGWDGQEHASNPREVALSQVAGYVQRRYVHRQSGAGVMLLVVCGRPGP